MGAPETIPVQPLSVTLALDPQMQQHLAEASGIITHVESIEIDSPAMAEYANGELRQIIERKKRIEAMKKDFVAPAKLIVANAEKWFDPSLDAHAKAEQIVKGKLGDFTKKEHERVAAEERARREAERRAREEAEQAAAAARARAEEAARKAREEAAKAEAERKRQEELAAKARADGDKRAAADAERRAQTAAAERAKKEEEERQRLAGAEAEANRIQLEASAKAQAAALPVQEAAKVEGFSMRKNWVAELADGHDEDRVKALIVEAISGGRRDLLSLLALDMKTAGKLAKTQEKNFSVPGLVARNNPVATSRG